MFFKKVNFDIFRLNRLELTTEPRLQKHISVYKNWLYHRCLLINEEENKAAVLFRKTVSPQVKKRRNRLRFSVRANAKRGENFRGNDYPGKCCNVSFMHCNRFISPHEFIAYRLIVSSNKGLNQMQTGLNFHLKASVRPRNSVGFLFVLIM